MTVQRLRIEARDEQGNVTELWEKGDDPSILRTRRVFIELFDDTLKGNGSVHITPITKGAR